MTSTATHPIVANVTRPIPFQTIDTYEDTWRDRFDTMRKAFECLYVNLDTRNSQAACVLASELMAEFDEPDGHLEVQGFTQSDENWAFYSRLSRVYEGFALERCRSDYHDIGDHHFGDMPVEQGWGVATVWPEDKRVSSAED